jgi:hypothetical protein
LEVGGFMNLVEFREGDALQTLSADLLETIDLLLLDGAKALYPEILSLVESHLRPVRSSSPTMPTTSLSTLRNPSLGRSGYLSIPFADNVELSTRSG